MERQIIKFLLLGMVVFSSCYYDVAETLYPASTCSTVNMSYATDIDPILQHNCYACHSAAVNNGNVTLEGYNNLIHYVNSGQVVGTIKHQSGFSPMPKNSGSLSDCEIAKIEQWIVQGSQNN
jgi:hypothetical protein